MADVASVPAFITRSCRRARWTITVTVIALTVLAAVTALDQWSVVRAEVTIALHYVGDDGRTYSCTSDYRGSKQVPIPDDIAASMNARDWSGTGQLVYEWAKAHPADAWSMMDDDPRSARAEASWGLAMDQYVTFPHWEVDVGNGPEFTLIWDQRSGGNCADGLM